LKLMYVLPWSFYTALSSLFLFPCRSPPFESKEKKKRGIRWRMSNVRWQTRIRWWIV
jgi:hypothetical protein